MILPYLYGAAICMVIVSPSWVSGYDYGCARSPCGTNSLCRETVGGRPVCSCPPGHSGNPLTYCHRAECLDHSECPSSKACRDGVCINPCSSDICGTNSICDARNHAAICTCPTGYTGNPIHSCRRDDPPADPCRPSPCGPNTNCKVVNGGAVCSCLQGFIGSPIRGCSHECEQDSQCRSNQICKSYECVAACTLCDENSACKSVNNHRPVCECVNGYLGGSSQCATMCRSDGDCPRNKPYCNYGACKNPCDGVCGVGANCELKNNLTPVCSCPRDMTGDPFVQCRPFTAEDACKSNPCGVNAECKAGHNRDNQLVPVCSCPPGFNGNPLVECRRGECQVDSECTDDKACIGYECKNPCTGQCGTGAICEPKRHTAVCKCPAGYVGHPFEVCRPKH